MRIGAHTYLFTQYGYDQAARVDELFDTVAAAGYQAIELPNQALEGPDAVQRIAAAVRRTSLGLVGASNGQPLWDTSRRAEVVDRLTAHAERLAALAAAVPQALQNSPTGKLQCGVSCSGKRYADRTAAENDQAIALWQELGALYRDRGLQLAYHTHGEPIADVELVLDHVPPDLLSFGPDLDWLRVGGIDPEACLRRYAPRLTMMHLRDYRSGGTAAQDRTAALGEGDVDYASLARTLSDIHFTGDLVVELALPPNTPPTIPPADLLRRSRDHLRQAMSL